MTITDQIAAVPANGRTRFTKTATFTHEDLTETTANTAQSFTVDLPAKTYIANLSLELVTPFEDVSDNAYNATTLTVGDLNSGTQFLSSTELNKNGTEVYRKEMSGSAKHYPDATEDLVFAFGSMAAKSLSNIDKGEVRIHLEMYNPGDIA